MEAWNIVVGKKVLKTQSQIDIINTVTNENMEINKREKNVIIFGLEESNKTDVAVKKKDDLVSVGNLMEQVLMEEGDIVRLFRLKSKKGISALVVEISNQENRNEFIKRSNRKFNKVYVNPDLTESQRNLDKQLREKCKELNKPLNLNENWDNVTSYYGIRNNQVIKINEQQQSNSSTQERSLIDYRSTSSQTYLLKDSKFSAKEGKDNLRFMYTNATSLNNKIDELRAVNCTK